MKFEALQLNQSQERGSEKPEVLILNESDVKKEITSLVGKIAEVQRMSVVGEGNRMTMDARLIHKAAGEFGLTANFKSDGESIKVDGFSVEAGFFKKGLIEHTLESALPDLIPQMRAHFQERSTQPLDKIWIENGLLRVSFKGDEAPSDNGEPEIPSEKVGGAFDDPLDETLHVDIKPTIFEDSLDDTQVIDQPLSRSRGETDSKA